MSQTISIVISLLVLGFFVFEIGFWVGRAQGVRDMRSPTKRAADGAQAAAQSVKSDGEVSQGTPHR